MRKSGQYLVRQYNTWHVKMTIPKEPRQYFPYPEDGPKKHLCGQPMVKVKKSLDTDDFAMAEIKKLSWLQHWKMLFKSYRSSEAEPKTINDLAKRWKAQLERSNYSTSALEQVALETLPLEDQQTATQENLADLVAQIPENAVAAFQKSTGALCALEDHVDDFLASTRIHRLLEVTPQVLSKTGL